MHALDITQVTFDRGPKGAAHLGLMWDFVAKNQLPGHLPRQFHVSPLASIMGPEDLEYLSLCPVRALIRYIEVTRVHRRQRKRLFLPSSTTASKEVTRNTVAFWLRSTILRAYKAAGLAPPSASNPHEIWALTSTMAIHTNCAVGDVIRGCFWQGDTTFANYYLRDISVEDIAGIHSFGPLVLAQQLAVPARPRR